MKNKHRNEGQQRPQYTLRALFCVLFFLLMIGTIILSFLISSAFLERYYLNGRKNALIRVYGELQNASVQDILQTDEFDRTLQESLRRDNLSLLVMDSGTNTVKVWSADEGLMAERLYSNLFGLTPVLPEGDRGRSALKQDPSADSAEGLPSLPGSGDNTDAEADDAENAADGEEEQALLDDELFFSQYVITSILEQEQPYTINVVLDRRSGTKSLEMWGPLGDGSYFLLRSPLEDIRNSAAAANRFFGNVCVLLAVAGALLAWWLSGRITEPLRQLTAISVRMKKLDFSAKYEGGRSTELDILGNNMNELSQKLEETISALRTANNDLQRDLDRRDRQEEMRQEFLSNVTHELKTPIALIRGYAEGLQDGIADDPESRAFYLDTIVEESDRMNTIVQKVLMLNQLEFGDGSVSMERFDLAGMIRNYLESASLLARQEQAELLFEQEEPLHAWGDPFLIQEVFQNYYSNAIHHVKPDQNGEKVIDIRLDEKKNGVRVTVFNTGDPIPAESLPHIWEKFYKVDKARTRAYGGSGVGLSIVKAIMDLHHKAYGAENYENGVAFWFELDRDDTSGGN